MKNMETVNVDLNIEDVMALAEYHHKMYKSIPSERYSTLNLANTTIGDVAKKYLSKARYWENILNENWPE